MPRKTTLKILMKRLITPGGDHVFVGANDKVRKDPTVLVACHFAAKHAQQTTTIHLIDTKNAIENERIFEKVELRGHELTAQETARHSEITEAWGTGDSQAHHDEIERLQQQGAKVVLPVLHTADVREFEPPAGLNFKTLWDVGTAEYIVHGVYAQTAEPQLKALLQKYRSLAPTTIMALRGKTAERKFPQLERVFRELGGSFILHPLAPHDYRLRLDGKTPITYKPKNKYEQAYEIHWK